MLAHAPALTDEQIDRILDTTADSFVRQLRSPIMHAPSEQGLVYEEITFPALNGGGNYSQLGLRRESGGARRERLPRVRSPGIGRLPTARSKS